MTAPIFLPGPVEDRSVPVALWCLLRDGSVCRRIVGRDLADVERLHAEHVAESRDADEHELELW